MLNRQNYPCYSSGHQNMMEVCMKGDIYTCQKCPVCNSKMIHNERKNNCFCVNCGAPASKGYFVRFGRDLCKRFTNDYAAASQFLSGIRFKTVEKTFDRRDYQKDSPLSFTNQAEKWLQTKQSKMKPRSWQNIANLMSKAIRAWGHTNVKAIQYKQLEDLLYNPSVISNDKTRANFKSCLNDFFGWLKKREGIPVPDMPECPFELGWRNYTDWETQELILDEIKAQTYAANPKVWFAIELLSCYAEFRPDDLRRITESDYDERHHLVVIRNPTKKKNQVKIVRLVEEHAEIWEDLKAQFPGLPHMPFFRHIITHKGVSADHSFGTKFLYKKWKAACKKLGIEGLDLYGGTRHTSVTELARIAGRDNAKKFSGHNTDKAFGRYCQTQDDTSFEMAKVVVKKKRKPAEVIKFEKKPG